jgi:hypothetical protein
MVPVIACEDAMPTVFTEAAWAQLPSTHAEAALRV